MNFIGGHNLVRSETFRNVIGTFLAAVFLSAAVSFSSARADQVQPLSLDFAGVRALKEKTELQGEGIKFALLCPSVTYIEGKPQNDYIPDIAHNCLAFTDFTFYDQGFLPARVSDHSTAVCSILFGKNDFGYNEELGSFRYEGVSPLAKAEIYESKYFLANHVFEANKPDADIITASFGWPSEGWWIRGIDAMAEHNGLVITAGIGNGSEVFDPLLYPGACANAIGVGVVDSVKSNNAGTNLRHFSLAFPEHSSAGPTLDGRCKPDIVTGGNCLVADASDPNNYIPTGNWSSYSTPIVSGVIGLLIEKVKSDPNLQAAISPLGGNCVLKAIVMNSAIKLPYWHKGRIGKDDDHLVPLDRIQGAGTLNAEGAYELLRAGQALPGQVEQKGWDLGQLSASDSPENIYSLEIAEPEGKMITATMVWNRHFENKFPFKPLANSNLRLEVWAIDHNEPAKSYLLDYSDSPIDNVEHVYCRADANFTDYEIVTTYSDIDQPDSSEVYAAAWSVESGKNEVDIRWYDLNGDGIVNDSDLLVLANYLLDNSQLPGSYRMGDLNGDGKIDLKDIEILTINIEKKADWYQEDKKESSKVE